MWMDTKPAGPKKSDWSKRNLFAECISRLSQDIIVVSNRNSIAFYKINVTWKFICTFYILAQPRPVLY